MRLLNKIATITGSGSGVGRASALIFSKEGAKISVVDIDDKGGQQTVEMVKQKGGEAIFIKADVSKESDVERMVKTTVDNFGRLDILFNNAGFPMASTPLEQVKEELWNKVCDINLKGVFYGSKHVIPIMRNQGGGSIINTASIGGVRPRPGYSAYHPAKAAVISLTKVIALEVAADKIRVNCINPVAIDTPMFPRFLSESGAKDEKFEEIKKSYIAGIPLGRLAMPEDVAYAALFFASDEASFLTGVSLNVDGGRSI